MSLLSLMPGEIGGIPVVQPQPQPMGGLLGDPKVMFGLSLLANNNSKSFGQNLGRAGMQTLGAMQQMQQQQMINDWRASQQMLAQTRMEREQKQAEAEAAKQQQQQEAEKAFLTQHPEIDQTLFKINPQLAMKQGMPQQDNSYYQAIPTPQGLARFNARSGDLELIKMDNGLPIVKSSDSPSLQGEIAESKARGAAGYKINTAIPGKVFTDRQVADQATGGYPMQVSPQVQAERDKVRRNILLAERDQYGAGNNPALEQEMRDAGIRVPTKAEEAAQVESAKFGAKAKADAQADLSRVVDEGNNAIKLVDELLNHEGFEGAVGLSSYNPLNRMAGSPENDFNIRLDQIKGKQFLQAFQTLKGGGQITEVEGKKATDAIARMQTSASEGEFKKAAEDFKQVIRAGINRANQKAGVQGQIMPSDEPMQQKRSREDILKQYGAI